MIKGLSCYINAFKNTFNYKGTATRQELNWFIFFFVISMMILISIWFVWSAFYSNACFGTDCYLIIVMLFLSLIIGCIIHFFPLTSLIKRRFNYIIPQKSKLYYCIWLISSLIPSVSFLYLISTSIWIPDFISEIVVCLDKGLAIVAIVTVIFLMVRNKPL